MRFLFLVVTLVVAVISTARPNEEPAPPAFMNMTAQEPGTQDAHGTKNLPNYNMLKLFTEPNQRGLWWHIDRIAVKYSTCLTWIDVDKIGGISSLQSFKNQQGLPFYCFNYASTDCTGNTFWWKGVIRLDYLPPDWDNNVRSTRCHHGRFPDDIPLPDDVMREEATPLVADSSQAEDHDNKSVATPSATNRAPDDKQQSWDRKRTLVFLCSNADLEGSVWAYPEEMLDK